MGKGDPIRERRAVYHRRAHLGYVTTIRYPDRDLTLFSEGSPYREIVIADYSERHVALLQQYKEHWLIQCGGCYTTTDRCGELSGSHAKQLAAFALAQGAQPDNHLVELLKERIDGLLPRTRKVS